jgi:hypothetical protein
MMEKLLAAIGIGVALALIVPIVFVFCGALSGWVAGLVFETEIMGFLSRVGVNTEGLTMWQLGAGLGFVGSFFKPNLAHSKAK